MRYLRYLKYDIRYEIRYEIKYEIFDIFELFKVWDKIWDLNYWKYEIRYSIWR
jgi:hypothetical protein